MDILYNAPINPFSRESMQTEVMGYLDRRSAHINNWLFAVRLTVGIGFAGYIFADVTSLSSDHLTSVLLAGCYILANIGIWVIYLPSNRLRARINAIIDIFFLFLLRHYFFFEIAVDPNATMVGLFSLLLLIYTLYSDTLLIGIVGVTIVALTEITLLLDVNAIHLESLTASSSDNFSRTQPFRVIVLMGYLGIVTITTFFVARRLEGLIRMHIREQQRVISTALESSVERSKRENLEQLNALKGDFISVLSHELRTPLSPLSAALELLEEELSDRKDLRYALDASLKAKDRLQQLVNDYIELAELLTFDNKSIASRKIELQSFIPKILKEHDICLEQIDIQTNNDITVSSDPRLLGGAILALLRRAASFTPQDEKIRLRAYEEDERINISIQDLMSYLDPEEAANVGDLFSSSRERIYHSENTGLELVLAQHSLKRIGSRLRVESKKGKGTLIVCSLPSDIESD